MNQEVENLIELVSQGEDQIALAKLLTAIERMGPVCLNHSALLKPPTCSFRVGITGPPGAGKSSLIGKLIGDLRGKGLSVGILAVDPSSPFSNGAILGDRIRYSDHFNDPGVFIRSIGSRGSLGGLSSAAYLMLRAFDLFGFDIVLIETVGVGQTELEVMHVADFVSVVLVPESGDSVQAMKAGLLEIADQFIVNKSDRPGADSMARELEAMVQMSPSSDAQQTPVVKTVATRGEGIKELADFYESQIDLDMGKQNRESPERLKWEARALLRAQFDVRVEESVRRIIDSDTLASEVLGTLN